MVFVSSLLVQNNGRFAVGGTYNGEAYLSYHENSGAPVAGLTSPLILPSTTNILVGIRDPETRIAGGASFSVPAPS